MPIFDKWNKENTKEICLRNKNDKYLALLSSVFFKAPSRFVKLQSHFFVYMKNIVSSYGLKKCPGDFVPASLATWIVKRELLDF